MGYQYRSALLLVASCLLLLPEPLPAQSPVPAPVQFTALTTEDGLSHGLVMAILQDRKGFMWFGTDQGLNRYDGYSFTTYRRDGEGPLAASANEVYALLEDSQQRLWIGTGQGLCIFDRATHRFIDLQLGAGLPTRTKITRILEDRSGGFWISTGRGLEHVTLLRPDKSPSSWTRADLQINHNAATDTLRQYPSMHAGAITLLLDSKGTLFAVNSEAVFRITPGTGGHPSTARRLYTFPRGDEYTSGVLLEDTTHHGYLLQTPGALLTFPDASFTAAPTTVPAGAWYPPAQAPDGVFYLIHGKTIARWKPGMNAPDHIVADNPATQLAFENARCLYWDRNHNLWIGTNGYGILKQGRKSPFSHALDGTYITDVWAGANNDVFVNKRYHLKFLAKGNCTVDSSQAIFDDGYQDTSAYQWRLDGSTLLRVDMRLHVRTAYRIPGCHDAYFLRPVFKDAAGIIWLQHADSLVRFDAHKGTFSSYRFDVPVHKTDDWDFFQNGLVSGQTVWLGTKKGLFSFDTVSRIWGRYPQQPGDTAMQQNLVVTSILADPLNPEQFIWISTSGGAWRLDKHTGRFTVYNRASGMPDEMINKMLPDQRGHLWVSTNKGLTRIDPATGNMQHYGRAGGLQNHEYNRQAGAATTGGILVFGGLDGIDYFAPEAVRPLPPPPVSLTGMRLFNRPVNPGDSASPLKEDIAYTRDLWLPYHQDMLTLVFAGMDYSQDGALQYRYRLKGFNTNWVYAGKSHEATYTSLEPGAYEFYVQAGYPGGEWSNQAALLTLHIIHPWWRTWWFYTALLLAVCGALYGLYRYRIGQVMKMERIRTAIARDLHDDIGATLSTIAIYANVARQQLDQPGRNPAALLEKIMANSHKLTVAVRDMIWSINTRPGDFGAMLSRMREHAADLFEAKHSLLHIDFPDHLTQLKLPVEKWRDFYLIYKEALNNMAKYAQAGQVWISLRKSQHYLELCVKDDGVGFDTGRARPGGNGLANMKVRATAIGGSLVIVSKPGEGTTVTLRV